MAFLAGYPVMYLQSCCYITIIYRRVGKTAVQPKDLAVTSFYAVQGYHKPFAPCGLGIAICGSHVWCEGIL